MQHEIIEEDEYKPADDTINNMGVRNTCFIHWLSFVIPDIINIETIINRIIGLKYDDFVENNYGKNGYTKSFKHHYLDISIYKNIDIPNMGNFIEIKGSACELIQNDIYNICSKVRYHLGKFSRIDIAVDDHDEVLNIHKIYKSAKNGDWSGRFRKTRQIESNNSKGNDYGKTITFGSRRSNTFLRIYDKGKQERKAGHWIRCELELKKQNAQNAIALLMNGTDLREIYFGILKSYINFKIASNDTNKSRWKLEPWWEEFLGNSKKLKIGPPKRSHAMGPNVEWLLNQCSLAIYESYQREGVKFILLLLKVGAEKHTKKRAKNISPK